MGLRCAPLFGISSARHRRLHKSVRPEDGSEGNRSLHLAKYVRSTPSISFNGVSPRGPIAMETPAKVNQPVGRSVGRRRELSVRPYCPDRTTGQKGEGSRGTLTRPPKKICRCPLPSPEDVYNSRRIKRAHSVLKDSSHPGQHLLELLP